MRMTMYDENGNVTLNPGAFIPYTPPVIQMQEALVRLAEYEDRYEREESE